MIQGILGKKLGATQVFLEDGRVEPVTAIQVGPCTVTQVRTKRKDGYEAVQLGFEEVRRLNKPEAGHLKGMGPFRHLREVMATELGDVQVGQKVDASLFQPGEIVDVIGVSKGRGFQGGVRRHGFKGGPKTHGQSDRLRAPGSIGATTYPARVLKGRHMAGHMGDRRVTVQNLLVVQSDSERNLIMVRGAVPGASNGLVLVRRAKKAAPASATKG
ncbi:MAG: 50S ribosomal protein L3 [Chloroflexi bacterium]|nr:50S ribosomal protein L3 [Chloroflexota bacterium]